MEARVRIGIVGAGRVGTALGVAITRAGWPVTAVLTRDPGRRAALVDLLPTARALDDPGDLPGVADVLLLTVPDDALAEVAASLPVGGGQGLVHTSGAQPSRVLGTGRPGGPLVASFHPLVPFASLDGALASLPGATIALEGDAPLVELLERLALDLGARPMLVSATGKAAYHAAAVLAAGGFVALLSGITELGSAAGMDETAAIEAFGGLVRAGLGNAERWGVAAALTGPFVRGDVSTVRLHLEALDRLAPDVAAIYRVLAERQLSMAVDRGELRPEVAAGLGRVLREPAG